MSESENGQDFSAYEKAALVTWHLCQGEGVSTDDVARLTGLHRSNAWRLMVHLSRVLPVIRDDEEIWQVEFVQELAVNA